MDRNSVSWKGYIPAITTTFDEQGELDAGGMRELLRWYLQEGMHGVVTLGTQGEWFNMRYEEKYEVMSVVSEEMKGKCTIIAGCNDFSVDGVVRNAAAAEELGFDGMLLSAPPYMKPTEREIYEFYKAVSERVNLPVCVYNWPPGTNVDMSFELLDKLADLDKVVAIKNSTPNLHHFINVFSKLRHKVKVFGIPISELGLALMQQPNADGMMGAGGVLGKDQPDFFNHIWNGRYRDALELSRKDNYLMNAFFHADYTGKFGSAQAIFKAALNLQGLPGGHVRKPLLDLKDDGVAIVRATLEELGRL
ncbi:dihydrodipicolinate synthase family protein [Halioxenophilus aromaticivorans]|uniref:4-hydroxy-tetrahydrodipicolinate synthase n=1 Tax=Halioxenophilus aromaticivorans TaxID=1306992 RepID=A0AAV3TYM1_9ALTE